MTELDAAALEALQEGEWCIMNDGSPTYLHPGNGSYCAVDLSVFTRNFPGLFIGKYSPQTNNYDLGIIISDAIHWLATCYTSVFQTCSISLYFPDLESIGFEPPTLPWDI